MRVSISKVATWAIMSLSVVVTLSNAIANEEVDQQTMCLAKNIYYEAGLEHYEGRLAVAQVTINRVEHDAYPDSVCDVVYHKTRARATGKTVCQFSWVCETNRHRINYASNRWNNSVQLAKDVISEGLRFDQLSDALFFHNTQVNPQWGLERLTRIGNHIFYSEKPVRKNR
jgi:N-acetylmuramoyl-L-alanine amidase